jgi:hypothetical protein
MANYRHKESGSLVVSRKVRISEAFANGETTNFEIEQPKDTVIDSVIVRTVGTVTMASAVDITFSLGTDSDYDGEQVVADVIYLDGSDTLSVLAGTAKTCTIVDGVNTDAMNSYGNAASIVTDERTLYGKFVVGAANVSGGNEVEVHVAFRQF